MKTNYFSICKTLEEVKKLYKKLALLYHPDRPGGDKNTMQDINMEYERIIKDPAFINGQQTDEQRQDSIKFPEIINQVINLDVIIEVIGNWIWISGNTWRYKTQLKEIGFIYASKKKMWFWRPSAWKSKNHEPWSIDKIRKTFGSDRVNKALNLELEFSDIEN